MRIDDTLTEDFSKKISEIVAQKYKNITIGDTLTEDLLKEISEIVAQKYKNYDSTKIGNETTRDPESFIVKIDEAKLSGLAEMESTLPSQTIDLL